MNDFSLYLFGSEAKKNSTLLSDIDLLYVGKIKEMALASHFIDEWVKINKPEWKNKNFDIWGLQPNNEKPKYFALVTILAELQQAKAISLTQTHLLDLCYKPNRTDVLKALFQCWDYWLKSLDYNVTTNNCYTVWKSLKPIQQISFCINAQKWMLENPEATVWPLTVFESKNHLLLNDLIKNQFNYEPPKDTATLKNFEELLENLNLNTFPNL